MRFKEFFTGLTLGTGVGFFFGFVSAVYLMVTLFGSVAVIP